MGTRRFAGACALLLSGGVVAAVGAAGLERLSFLFCGFRALTGLPCPLCFGTRAVHALAHGEWGNALTLNPLAVLAVVALAASGLILLAGREPPWLRAGRQRAVLTAGLTGVGVNWGYLLLFAG